MKGTLKQSLFQKNDIVNEIQLNTNNTTVKSIFIVKHINDKYVYDLWNISLILVIISAVIKL